MSEALSQNAGYTILSSEDGRDITLFWTQYINQTRGIRPWYYIQQSTYMDGHQPRERFWDTHMDMSFDCKTSI